MERVLAIDHGLKRTGLAVTDPARIIASALETVETANLFDYLKAYLVRERVEGFVTVGERGGEAGPKGQGRTGSYQRHHPVAGLA